MLFFSIKIHGTFLRTKYFITKKCAKFEILFLISKSIIFLFLFIQIDILLAFF